MGNKYTGVFSNGKIYLPEELCIPDGVYVINFGKQLETALYTAEQFRELERKLETFPDPQKRRMLMQRLIASACETEVEGQAFELPERYIENCGFSRDGDKVAFSRGPWGYITVTRLVEEE